MHTGYHDQPDPVREVRGVIEDKWTALEKWIQAYILFGKLDRHIGTEILELMEQLKAAYPV
jgi:hypothetical protein